LDTGKAKRVIPSSENVWEYFADRTAPVRIGIGSNNGDWWLLYRPDGEARFRTVHRHKANQANPGAIGSFVPVVGSDLGYAIAGNAEGRLSLYRYDFSNGASLRVEKGVLTYFNPAKGIVKPLFQAEKQLLNNDGLPQRPWYKHTIYAPGFYTGYGVKTLPGIRESIEQGDWEEANKQIKIATQRLNNLADYLGASSTK
ncbi:MAG: hypothetical protein EOO88_55965, partial [Pedobacter sp.]